MFRENPVRRWHILGLDCAVDASRVGVAHGILKPEADGDDGRSRRGVSAPAWNAARVGGRPGAGSRCRVDGIVRSADWAELIAGTCAFLTADMPVLLAVDAPLGWPSELGSMLSGHTAGAPVAFPADRLFRRETDRVVRRELGKQTLDVGADRIARTAVAALGLIHRLGEARGVPVRTVCSETELDALRADRSPADALFAVEVYPAGWLAVAGLPSRGYKGGETGEARREIVNGLEEFLELDVDRDSLTGVPDLLDAAVCVAAGADVLAGRSPGPERFGVAPEVAGREGWIWLPLSGAGGGR